MRSDIPALAVTALILMLGAGAASLAKPKIITLPPETTALKEASEPGFELTANNCAVCHSVDYIVTQPRGKGKEFWTGEVTKMVNVYGATIQDADRPAIIDYLAHNY
jgi:mono/diheme cytochrome c family protein